MDEAFLEKSRDNQLYGRQFPICICTELWLNLRPLYLADQSAAPKQIGLVLAIGGFSAGVVPIPVGIISNRFGPRRVMAFQGAILITLAPT